MGAEEREGEAEEGDDVAAPAGAGLSLTRGGRPRRGSRVDSARSGSGSGMGGGGGSRGGG